MRRITALLMLVACTGTEPPRAPTPVAIAADAAPTPEQPAAPPDAAPAPALAPPEQKTELPLPGEPWYRDQAQRDEECVAPLAQVPTRHFPAPFEACDPHVEAFASPPGGPELHFHYRDFSPALTREHRASSPTTCCYMIFEFPRRHR
jgi:hypothetical protein